jgi:hypothetical protein
MLNRTPWLHRFSSPPCHVDDCRNHIHQDSSHRQATSSFSSLQSQMQQCGEDPKHASVQAREEGNEAVEKAMNDTHLHHREFGLMPSQGNEAEKDRGNSDVLTCEHVDFDNVENFNAILTKNAMSIADANVLSREHVVGGHKGHLASSLQSNAMCYLVTEVARPVHAGVNQVSYLVEAIKWNALIISEMHIVVDRSGAMGRSWNKVLILFLESPVLIDKDGDFFKSRCWVMGRDCRSALLPSTRLGEHLPTTLSFDFINPIPPFRHLHQIPSVHFSSRKPCQAQWTSLVVRIALQQWHPPPLLPSSVPLWQRSKSSSRRSLRAVMHLLHSTRLSLVSLLHPNASSSHKKLLQGLEYSFVTRFRSTTSPSPTLPPPMALV